jgi:hypothetical protein
VESFAFHAFVFFPQQPLFILTLHNFTVLCDLENKTSIGECPVTKSENPITVAHDAMVNALVEIATEVNRASVLSERDFVDVWFKIMQTGLLDAERFVALIGLPDEMCDQIKQWSKYNPGIYEPGKQNPLPTEQTTRRGFIWFALEVCVSKLVLRSDNRPIHQIILDQAAEKAVDDYVAEERFGADSAEALSRPDSAKNAVRDLPPGLGGESAKMKLMPDGRPWDTLLEDDPDYESCVAIRGRKSLKGDYVNPQDGHLPIITFKDLVVNTEAELLCRRMFARKSLNGVTEFLSRKDLSLGMTLD